MTFNILFVTARSFPYVGGVETHTHEVARRLAARGHGVTILSTDKHRTLPRDERSEEVRTIRVPAWPREGDFHFAPGVYAVIRGGAWDLVHVQGYHTLVPPIAMLAAAQSKIPFVVTFHSGGHSSTVRNSIRGFQQRALGPLLARADKLIGVSEFEVETFRDRLKLPASRFVVVPNGAEIGAVDLPAAGPSDVNLIISVGRLERYKGHQRAITAMPGVLRALPGARLQIVGTGPFEAELRAIAARLGISEHVEFVSVASGDRQSMAEVFLRSSLVVLLSDYEAHPISVMEALALGRPVLVTHTSGLAELAERGLVRSVPSKATPLELSAAILTNLEHPLIPQATSLPSWDECVDRLSVVYDGVISRPSAVALV
jgi:glycosyltransferase involved in cell wall biosynthesis